MVQTLKAGHTEEHIYIQPFSAGLMIVAGEYIVYYWLTIGGLGNSILF